MEEGQGLSTSDLFTAYLAGEAGAFFEGHFLRADDWDRVRRVARPIHPDLATALEAQNARYEPSSARDAHLRSLRTGAAAVVTGQQAGLFLGPLYTVYKAASTIRLARRLAEQWGTPVVPVFWIQTEDHDAAEIAVCHVARGSDEPLTLKLDIDAEPISVAHRTLPAAVADILATLGEVLEPLPHGAEHLASLSRHYRAGAGWGAAFAGLLAELFADDGLVLLDPRDPAAAELAAPVHRRALTEARPIASAMVARVGALEAAGWRGTVHVREDCPLSFFHPDGPEGPRRRLTATADGFIETRGTRGYSLTDLLNTLDGAPLSFSTSALLRPVLQDTWLPTVAYVGGPAEVAYFAQLAPLYAAFDLTMPIVVPRARIRLVESATRRTLLRRGVTPAEACLPIEELLKVAHAGTDADFDGSRLAQRVRGEIDRALAEVAPRLSALGERGEEALDKTRRTMSRSAEQLGASYDRARMLSDREIVDDLTRAQARLLPGGIPQERVFGIPSFAGRHGQRTFVARVVDAAAPFSSGIEDLDL